VSPGRQPAHPRPSLLGLCGSLRAGSHNARLLRYVATLLDGTARLDIFDSLGGLPLYNADLDTEQHRPGSQPPAGNATPKALPPAVSQLRQAIRRADGIIVATPEYNHAIPGVLKNALDWASRPTTDLPLTGKPIAVFVATRSRVLGHRALSDTARILTGFANIVIPGPEVVVTSAHDKLTTSCDGTVQLADPYAANAIQQQVAVLRDLITTGAARHLGTAMRQHVPNRWW
jgi:chromate reductase, NAD(P)H dehydrogenase (quinone)